MDVVGWAEALGAAVDRVAGSHEPVGPGREVLLHQQMRKAFSEDGRLAVHESEQRFADHGRGWTRPPDGIDVVVESADGGSRQALVIECKIGKPDELLWDAVKLAQRVGPAAWQEAAAAAALVVEVGPSQLHDPRVQAWFGIPDRLEVERHVGRWPKDWYGCMTGGRGVRPTTLPRVIRLGAGGRTRHADGTCREPVREGPSSSRRRTVGSRSWSSTDASGSTGGTWAAPR